MSFYGSGANAMTISRTFLPNINNRASP